MHQVKIPGSVDEVVQQLGALGRLIQAKEWERAAIVAAFVEPDIGNGGRQVANSGHLISCREFAEFGITGLRSKGTVARYAENWLAVRPRPKPGSTVNLDGLPDWPPDSKTPDITPGAQKVKDVKSNAKAVATALADPVFRQRVLDRVDDITKYAVNQESFRPEKYGEPVPKTPLMDRLTKENEAARHLTVPLHFALQAIRRVNSEWTEYISELGEFEKSGIANTVSELTAEMGVLEMYALEATAEEETR